MATEFTDLTQNAKSAQLSSLSTDRREAVCSEDFGDFRQIPANNIHGKTLDKMEAALLALGQNQEALDNLRKFQSCLEELHSLGYPNEDWPCAHWVARAAILCAKAKLDRSHQAIAWHVLYNAIKKEAPFDRCRQEAASIIPPAWADLMSTQHITDTEIRCFSQICLVRILCHCHLSMSLADVPGDFDTLFPSLADTLIAVIVPYSQEPMLNILEFTISRSEVDHYLECIAILSRKLDPAPGGKEVMDNISLDFVNSLMQAKLYSEADVFNSKRIEAIEKTKGPCGTVAVPGSPRVTEKMVKHNPFLVEGQETEGGIVPRNSGGGKAQLCDVARGGHSQTDVLYGEQLGAVLNMLGSQEDASLPEKEGPGPHAPSTRMWLGNIAAHVKDDSVRTVFSHFGKGLADGAVFPARIGPLGYAFINFHELEDAISAYNKLNNTAVPSLSGNKLLKMRFKPASEFRGNRGRPSSRVVAEQQERQRMQEDILRSALRQNSLPVLTAQDSAAFRTNNLGNLNSISVPPVMSQIHSEPGRQSSVQSSVQQADLWEQMLRQQTARVGHMQPDGMDSSLLHSNEPGLGSQQGSSYTGQNASSSTSTLADLLNPMSKSYDKNFANLFSTASQAEKEQLWAMDRQSKLSEQANQAAMLQQQGLATSQSASLEALANLKMGILPGLNNNNPAGNPMALDDISKLLNAQGMGHQGSGQLPGLTDLQQAGQNLSSFSNNSIGGFSGYDVMGGYVSNPSGPSSYGLHGQDVSTLGSQFSQMSMRNGSMVSATSRDEISSRNQSFGWEEASAVPFASQGITPPKLNASSVSGLAPSGFNAFSQPALENLGFDINSFRGQGDENLVHQPNMMRF